MSNVWLGIDPGLTGAIAVIERNELQFFDTPVLSMGKRHVIDAAKSAERLKWIKDKAWFDAMTGRLLPCTQRKYLMVTVEKSQPMPPIRRGPKKPGEEAGIGHGSIASFSLGYSFGIWVGILAALEIPYQLVAPKTWKAALLKDMPKDKDASRLAARRLWPDQTEEALSRKKDHGRAEAALIAEYGRRISGRLDE